MFHRGQDVEDHAFLYVAELEQIIREWVGQVYHRTKHDGLCVPDVPGLALSPAEMFEIGLAKTGGLPVPASPDLPFLFLDVAWRTIQHYGVEVDGRRAGPQRPPQHEIPVWGCARRQMADLPRRPRRAPSLVPRPGHEVVRAVDVGARSRVGPAVLQGRRGVHQACRVAHQPARRPPGRGAGPARRVVAAGDQLSPGPSLAVKLAASRAHNGEPPRAVAASDDGSVDEQAARQVASLPGVIDLLATREQRATGLQVVDDLDEVFTRYYAQHPDQDAFGVFDE